MKELGAEQVGFVEYQEDGKVHMQMMGGEFCGNATRSFGYLMSMLSEDKPSEIQVDVSGSASLLTAEVDLEKGTSRTQMPLPEKVMTLPEIHGEVYSMVVFEGICHIIVKSAPKSQAFVDELIRVAEKVYPADAYGVMFLEGEKMTPVVFVKENGSMVWESSCGSGSMGAAVYLTQGKEDGTYTYQLHQPGGVIEASVTVEQGTVTQCKMGGPVVISQEMTVEVHV
ncbi:diaminopimelate epimerase [gut metagenome]|uniref:Diaminopimelate epimerase n=1 Tax=gut metagenome TaxID=749906 RepID=J9FX13_9ZZZZ